LSWMAWVAGVTKPRSGLRTTQRGQGRVLMSRSVTEPRIKRFRPERPWLARNGEVYLFVGSQTGDFVGRIAHGNQRFPLQGLLTHEPGHFLVSVGRHSALLLFQSKNRLPVNRGGGEINDVGHVKFCLEFPRQAMP